MAHGGEKLAFGRRYLFTLEGADTVELFEVLDPLLLATEFVAQQVNLSLFGAGLAAKLTTTSNQLF